MKTTCRWLTMLLLMVLIAIPPSQADFHSRGNKTSVSPGWAELQASMKKMHMVMASVKESDNSDADFVRLMVPHHQAAIDMAKTQLTYGTDPQMRRLAQEIITDQQSELELMQLWLKQHRSSSLKVDQTPVHASKED